MGSRTCYHYEYEKIERLKKIFAAILAFLFFILLVFFIIWAVLRPKKPNIILQDATIYSFNLTANSNQLTSIVQITIKAHNPNDHVSIYYDGMKTYATYHDQQITPPTLIPSTYQDTSGVNVWSPFLRGESESVAPYIGFLLNQDVSMGRIELVVNMDGGLRFKVGSYISRTYRMHVNCLAIIPYGNSGAVENTDNNNVLMYQLFRDCSVIV